MMKIELHALPDESTGLIMHLVLPAGTDPAQFAWLGCSTPTGITLNLSVQPPEPGLHPLRVGLNLQDCGFVVLGSSYQPQLATEPVWETGLVG